MGNTTSIFSIREKLILGIGRIFTKVLILLRYYDRYLPIQKTVTAFLADGYKIDRINGDLCVNGIDEFQEYKFLLRPLSRDAEVFRQIFSQNEYAPLVESGRNFEKNEIRVIVDAGSNIGLATLYFHKYFPQARIISIEAEESNYKQQVKNIHLNRIDSTAMVMHRALWNTANEKLNIHNNFRDGDSWAKAVGAKVDGDQAADDVSSITLDEIIKTCIGSGSMIDILKIDIEGAEVKLFEDPTFVLGLVSHVRFLGIEIHDEFNCREDIVRILTENNFIIWESGETTFCRNKQLT